MEIKGISTAVNFLESIPLNKITKYSDGPPKNSVPFIGYAQQHWTEKNKLVLVHDPLGKSPALLKFNLDDILYVEEVPQAVTEMGEGVPLIKLWIRRGARGTFTEPFEVDESIHFMDMRREHRERFSKKKPADPV